MSDIAMLVAEEYERRVKDLRKPSGSGSGSDVVSSVSVMVSRLKEENKHLLQWVLEPKTQLATAASNSFFSA